MSEKNMVKVPYEDFVELIKLKGRVETTLDWLKVKSGTITEDSMIIDLLTGASCGAE